MSTFAELVKMNRFLHAPLSLRSAASFFNTSAKTLAVAPKAVSVLGKLRKETGYSMSLCKKALETNNQDLELAKKWLEEQALEQGWAKAQKLEGRNTMQGVIGVLVRDRVGAMLELNCETDFVARNKQFTDLVHELGMTTLESAVQGSSEPLVIQNLAKSDLDSLNSSKSGQKLSDLVALNIGQLGENLVLKRGITFSTNEDTSLFGHTHPAGTQGQGETLCGRFGTLIALHKSGPGQLPDGQSLDSFAKQLCQHIIGMNPMRVGDLKKFDVANVKSEEAPAENVSSTIEKMQEGGETLDEDDIHSIETEQTKVRDHEELIYQPFLLDNDVTVGEILTQGGLSLENFARFEIGKSSSN